jgi:hypothetical protein
MRGFLGLLGRAVFDWLTANALPPTVTSALLALPVVLAATEKPTDDGPEPLAEATVTHDALFVTLQAQPACVVTSKDPLPPSLSKLPLVGDSEYEHPAAAACVTVTA